MKNVKILLNDMEVNVSVGDDGYRRQRQREASRGTNSSSGINKHVNSVSYIDQAARIMFPASFTVLNVAYWMFYVKYQEEFGWKDPPIVRH